MVIQQDIENPGWISAVQFAELALCLLQPKQYHQFCTSWHYKWYNEKAGGQ